MTSTTFFLVFIPILAIILLAVNLVLAPHSPYEEKGSAFECGFHSFQQTRSPFNISFFIFALLFLLFDLEILLVYPYVVSAYTNGAYGLIIMLIFFIMLTLGFVFELGKGALKIDSRQSDAININHKVTNNLCILINQNTYKKFIKESLPQRRSYSTGRGLNSSIDFWKKVNSSDKLDSSNPFIIANSFIKSNSNNKSIKDKIDYNLIVSILSCHISGFSLTPTEFDILVNINPIRLELSAGYKPELEKLIGKYVRKGETGKAGVYVFTNKNNGFCYVGSSISLANRLSTGYFGPTLGKRKIDSAITESGLSSFCIDLFILPSELVSPEGNNTSISKVRLKSLTLALEQILLLEFNPEYNVLKVAGSPAGLKRTVESMLPSFTKNSKPVYLYDTVKKALIYISKSLKGVSRYS